MSHIITVALVQYFLSNAKYINKKQKLLLCCMQSVEIGTIHLQNLFHQLFSLNSISYFEWLHDKMLHAFKYFVFISKDETFFVMSTLLQYSWHHVILFYINLDKNYLGVFVLVKNQVNLYWSIPTALFVLEVYMGPI